MMKFRIPPIPHVQIALAQEAIRSGSEEQIKRFLLQLSETPSDVQAFTGYALAAMYHLTETCGIPPYIFAFRKDIPKLRVPFSWLGWAGENSHIGPAYTLSPDCFTGGEITLYYSDEDMGVYSPSVREDKLAHAQDLAQQIEKHSSGISHVRAMILPGSHSSILAPDSSPEDQEGETCVVAFTLDPEAVKPSVVIQGREKSAQETGGFVFVLPRAGEFDCTMGELFDGGLRLPLRTDSYCMK